MTDAQGDAATMLLRAGFAGEEDECRSICAEDVSDDVCVATLTNPIPNGDAWRRVRDGSRYGCCAFGLGACEVCCPPSEEERRAFAEADARDVARRLFDGMSVDFDHFGERLETDRIRAVVRGQDHPECRVCFRRQRN